MNPRKKLYLVDVSNMFFRAFYAIRHLSNSKGVPTNAVYGFLNMSLKLRREEKPDYVAFCHDTKEPSFRKNLYEQYKANRTEMPEDLVPQLEYIDQIPELLGFAQFKKPGFEADDLIGALAKFGQNNDLDVTIVSGDKDFSQLVNEHVRIYDTMKEFSFTPEEVEKKYGVKPSQFIDYLSLVGDTSDNIPGVKGIGPKGAQKLISEFGTLEAVYENIESVKNPGLKQKLLDSKNDAFLSKKLVTIETEVSMNFSLEDLKIKAIDSTKAKAFLEELEFKNLESKIIEGVNTQTIAPGATPQTVEKTIAKPSLGKVEHGSSARSEVEGVSSSGFQNNQLKSISTSEIERSFSPRSRVVVAHGPQGLLLGTEKENFLVSGDLEKNAALLSKLDLEWSGFQVKDLLKTLRIDSPRIVADAALAAYLVTSEEVRGFEDVLSRTLSENMDPLLGGADLLNCHRRLIAELETQIQGQDLMKVYRDIELPLASVLYEIERRGVYVRAEVLMDQAVQINQDLKTLESEIIQEAGEEFSVASPKQLARILFEKLKMPVGRKTKTGYSTDSEVLEKLAKDYPICKKIIEHRELAKLKSTYVDSLPQMIDPVTGRIHTRLNQTVAATGRLSSIEPNLQNIPIKTPRGSAIRRAFMAPDGCQLISADYSQIELRVLAHITDDPGLCAAFASDLDIHSATASEIFDIKIADVTASHRRVAKEVNFGLAYGMSPFGLSQNLGISRQEATDIINRYFSKFGRVQDYMTTTIEEAQKNGYVKSLFGRRRMIKEIQSANQNIKKFGERAAINAPIQGTGADIIKMAMVDIFKNEPAKMILQVHDELLFESPESNAKEASRIVTQKMEDVVKLKVPIKVHSAIGKNWEEAH